MAWSAHKDEEQLTEHLSDDATVEAQAERLADLIRSCRHLVVFTGAGVSTSAGIPDFRGPDGVWTCRAQGRLAEAKTSTIKALPTPTHMAMVALAAAGKIQCLVSQNTDGIHRRSGFPINRLAELHGNSNLEICSRCKREFLRDYAVRSRSGNVHDHRTGRICPCGGELQDSIINFGESLPRHALQMGFREAENADVMLVLGSSLTVTPAADIPRRVGERGGHLVVCNLQKTPLDSLSTLRIFAKTDDLMTRVMKHMNMEIPAWRLVRHVQVRLEKGAGKELSLTVEGVEPDGTPASILSYVKASMESPTFQADVRGEPFEMRLPESSGAVSINLELHFMGHFHEPPIRFPVQFSAPSLDSKQKKLFRLSFDPHTRTWTLSVPES